MTRYLLLTCLLATAALLGATPAVADLYGAAWQGSLNLVRLKQDTLRPLPGPRVPLAGEPLGWSFSPDRSRLVIGSAPYGAKLRLIDLRAMRRLGDVRVMRRGSAIGTTWAGPRRVLAVVVTPGCCGAGDTIVAAVDTQRRRVLWRQTLGGSLQGGERWRRGLVLVLGPRGRSVGASRLVHVGPTGRIRSAALPQIRSGSEPDGKVTRVWDPGLAVDRAGGRAFVVGARAPLAEVNLRTLEVRSHPLELSARAADAVVGPTRQALWLGRGRLAVTGSDMGEPPRPAGLTLIDTRSGRARRVDAHTTDVALVSGTLLAFSFPRCSGLTGYTLDGSRRFHLLGRQPIVGAQALGHTALVGTRRATVRIDARTGRPVRRYRRLTLSLLARDAPFH
jgi:hypothetical protein